MDFKTDDTLPDDAWMDSFDKLLDQRPALRELNVIKKDIRASFNLNSSYENSSYDNTMSKKHEPQQMDTSVSCSSQASLPTNAHYLNIPSNSKGNERCMLSGVISTPVRNKSIANPFKCTLSPIGPWDLRHFSNKSQNVCKSQNSNVKFNATPITNNPIVNVEYVEELNSPKESNNIYSLGISPLVLVKKKWKSKQSQKQVCFASNELNKDNEITNNSKLEVVELDPSPLRPKIDLQPGKWRKSLNCLRRTQHPTLEKDRISLTKQHHKGRSTGVIGRPKSLATTTSIAGNRKSIYIPSNSTQTRSGSRSTYSLGSNDFKRQILQRCGQRRILTFDSAYNEDYLRNCYKIGEGAYGEVFVHSNPNNREANNDSVEKTVLKIIPIEGKEVVNGEVQKTYEQILPEVIISMELCNLSDDNRIKNVTSGFVNLKKVRCIKGSYPAYLQKLWEEYDLEKESENDHPNCFTKDQQYIVLELAYSGRDLEGFQFKNAEQTFYALQQIILTLAVGENEFQFEHRDLHWGNVLVLNTNRPSIPYKLGDDNITIPTKGIEITIIDYTLSRMTFNDYCFYNDLSSDEELFTATGDYQFEIYRMMRKVLNNKWETFEPKTNIYWISYIISKMVDGVTYKNIRSKNHLHYLEKLKQFQKSILTYKSCVDCVRNVLLQ
ncbi:serine/threonine-protein kinase haspin homolog isoform X1 [Lucilia cuprina]|uniref:serine/threonine-protein kinase haspin homolog isoform X1 n=2 Tax=Lucilia cuprina TaxID=7375 RepID=UPI001F06457E|nr:serine/threonine-protein kinase haspin homolog isoform X1 [Lucilia cuprina]